MLPAFVADGPVALTDIHHGFLRLPRSVMAPALIQCSPKAHFRSGLSHVELDGELPACARLGKDGNANRVLLAGAVSFIFAPHPEPPVLPDHPRMREAILRFPPTIVAGRPWNGGGTRRQENLKTLNPTPVKPGASKETGRSAVNPDFKHGWTAS
jgi:hypothetical protein